MLKELSYRIVFLEWEPNPQLRVTQSMVPLYIQRQESLPFKPRATETTQFNNLNNN